MLPALVLHAYLPYLERSPAQPSHIRGTERPKRESLFEADNQCSCSCTIDTGDAICTAADCGSSDKEGCGGAVTSSRKRSYAWFRRGHTLEPALILHEEHREATARCHICGSHPTKQYRSDGRRFAVCIQRSRSPWAPALPAGNSTEDCDHRLRGACHT